MEVQKRSLRGSAPWRETFFATALDILWILATLLVIAGSLLPAHSSAMESLARLNINDKVEHFAAYFVLALLPSLQRRGWSLSAFIGFALALGIALEYGQLYSPGRSFDVWDMVADATGTAVGLCAGLLSQTLPTRRPAS
jgi:VanZ family protein